MARLISLLLACVTTTDATSLSSPLTAAEVDADVRVPNASFAKKVNTAVLQVQTPGPSFLLFGFDSQVRHNHVVGLDNAASQDQGQEEEQQGLDI